MASNDSSKEKYVSSSSTGGIGFAGALTILFVALKLTHVVDWSWPWVLSPLWLSALLFIAVLLVIVVVAVIAHLFK